MSLKMEISGSRELEAKMTQFVGASMEAANRALQSAGLEIIAEAKQNLRENSSIVTGQLRASGRVQKSSDGEGLDVGFFSEDSQNGYALFVEEGRKPGKMPPVDLLVQWAHKKLRLPVKKKGMSGKSRSRGLKMQKPRSKARSLSPRERKPVTDANTMGWLIARKIARSGTIPHPFFGPAVEKYRDKIEGIISRAIASKL